MEFIYDLPTIVFGPLFILFVVALSIGGLMLVRRYASQSTLQEHNDITGFIIAVVGVIFAVALAFLVIVVWEDFSRSQTTVAREVDALSDVYHGVRVFPQPQRAPVRAAIKAYNGLMISEEWPAMQHGGRSADAEKVALRISDDVGALRPVGTHQRDEHRQLLQLSETFLDARRARLSQNDEGLPPIMWWTMAFGGALTIGFAYLFGGVNRIQHAVMVGMLAATIAAMFLLVIEINLPFRGDVGVSDHIWQTQQELFEP